MWKKGDNYATTLLGNTAIKIIHDKANHRLHSSTYNPAQFNYMFKQLIVKLPFYCDMVVGGIPEHNNQAIENYFGNLEVKLCSMIVTRVGIPKFLT